MTAPPTPDPSDRDTGALPIFLMVLAGLAYVAVAITLGRLPNVDHDEIFYKAPGREWAATGFFRSPELTGYLDVTPPLEQAWLIYPPLYPFLFGLFVKLVGFGWRQSVGFDAIIHVMTAAVTVLLVRRLTGTARSWSALLTFVAVLLLGVLGRPDDLATLFGLAAVCCLVRPWEEAANPPRMRDVLFSGVLLGLCGATSPIAGVAIGAIGFSFLAFRIRRLVTLFGATLAWSGIAAVIFSLTIIPELVAHPDAWKQFVVQAHLISHTDPRTIWQRFEYVMTVGHRLSVPTVLTLALGLLILAAESGRGQRARWAYHWSGCFLAMAALFYFKLHNYSYLWFVLPFALALCGAAINRGEFLGRPMLDRLGVAMLLVGVAIGATQFAKETLILALLPQEQTLDYNADLVRRTVPKGSTIMAYDLWWSLANDYRVFEHQASAVHWGEVQAVVSTSSTPIGPDDPIATYRDLYVAEHFTSVVDARNPEPVRFLGVALSESFRGFGVRIFTRAPATVP